LGGAREDCGPLIFNMVLEYWNLYLPYSCGYKNGVEGWCSRKIRVLCMQVGACISPVGVGTFRELMLPSSGFHRNQRVGALKKLELVK
jgi:hypothetical protein